MKYEAGFKPHPFTPYTNALMERPTVTIYFRDQGPTFNPNFSGDRLFKENEQFHGCILLVEGHIRLGYRLNQN